MLDEKRCREEDGQDLQECMDTSEGVEEPGPHNLLQAGTACQSRPAK